MQTLTFTQRWRMEDWVQEMNDVAHRAFDENEQIQWLNSQGYFPKAVSYHHLEMDVLEYSLVFRIPDEVRTMFLLKFPEETSVYYIKD